MLFPRSQTITLDAALRDVSDSRDPRVRSEAAAALGNIEGADDRRAAAGALVRALADSHPDVRASAAFSLGNLGATDEPNAIDGLVQGLDDDTALARQSCAIALGKLGAGFDALALKLAEGPADLRFQAATSLVEINRERAAAHLVKALGDSDPEVLSAVALGLGELGSHSALGERSREATDGLAHLLTHASEQTRFDAAYALAALGDDRAVDVLASFVEHKGFGWPAIDALHGLGSAAAAPALGQVLRRHLTVARHVKIRAAAALLAVAPQSPDAERARQEIAGGLRAFRVEARAVAAQSLGEVGGRWALAPLRQARSSLRGRPVRDQIDQAIARIEARGTD